MASTRAGRARAEAEELHECRERSLLRLAHHGERSPQLVLREGDDEPLADVEDAQALLEDVDERLPGCEPRGEQGQQLLIEHLDGGGDVITFEGMRIGPFLPR
jgi:hypothetical protein